MSLRRDLHARGLRYRVHRQPVPGLRREADLVFPRERVAVVVHGCFWHGCPEHATWPKANSEFWLSKINRNRERDADTESRFVAAGWTVVRVWEHAAAPEAADRVEAIVRATRLTLGLA